MEIKLINHGEYGEVLLIGRLDSSTVADAENVLNQISERFNKLTLNMEKLAYISSAGLRVLKRLHVTMSKKGGELELSNVNPMVMEVFEMTGFSGLLHIV